MNTETIKLRYAFDEALLRHVVLAWQNKTRSLHLFVMLRYWLWDHLETMKSMVMQAQLPDLAVGHATCVIGPTGCIWAAIDGIFRRNGEPGGRVGAQTISLPDSALFEGIDIVDFQTQLNRRRGEK